MNLLLAEDDDELAGSLIARFRDVGYVTEHVSDGRLALAAAMERDYSALVIDRMLPGMDGLSLMKELRRRAKTTPAIYLTTMAGIDDRVQGLEAGGDDYLVKPFEFVELLARVRAITRRSEGTQASKLVAGTLEMDLVQRSVRREGQLIELVPQEFRLLEYLMRNANRAVTRKMLLENVWDIHFDPHTNVVESHVSRLRARLNEQFDVDPIQTVRGVGYRLLAEH
ncbi:MAG TPA: response regulator transcription factor [Steroidobacteraceae bacterium]|jgi:two-component system, OmpR family, response regulator|nr:response regulator transcription factor [Steroidobacteraceae bacterium]